MTRPLHRAAILHTMPGLRVRLRLGVRFRLWVRNFRQYSSQEVSCTGVCHVIKWLCLDATASQGKCLCLHIYLKKNHSTPWWSVAVSNHFILLIERNRAEPFRSVPFSSKWFVFNSRCIMCYLSAQGIVYSRKCICNSTSLTHSQNLKRIFSNTSTGPVLPRMVRG